MRWTDGWVSEGSDSQATEHEDAGQHYLLRRRAVQAPDKRDREEQERDIGRDVGQRGAEEEVLVIETLCAHLVVPETRDGHALEHGSQYLLIARNRVSRRISLFRSERTNERTTAKPTTATSQHSVRAPSK